MSEREARLQRVAEAIADDLPIEWKDAKDTPPDARMRNLRELEKIRTVYREIESGAGSASGEGAATREVQRGGPQDQQRDEGQ